MSATGRATWTRVLGLVMAAFMSSQPVLAQNQAGGLPALEQRVLDLEAAPDADTLGGLNCTTDQIAKWDGSAWTCADDADTDTDTLGALSCAQGEVAKWNGTDWACAEDVDTDTDTNTDTLGSLGCTTDQIARFNGTAWVCDDLPGGFAAAEKVVFVTSVGFQGHNIGGVPGADRTCTQLARDAGLPGVFRAWISDSHVSPIGRFVPSAGPYVRTDGVSIADDWVDLTTCDEGASMDECLDAPISCDENMVCAPDLMVFRVWTGTDPDGTLSNMANVLEDVTCNDWGPRGDDLSILYDGVAGRIDRVDSEWTNDPGRGIVCPDTIVGHLYCFEQ